MNENQNYNDDNVKVREPTAPTNVLFGEHY